MSSTVWRSAALVEGAAQLLVAQRMARGTRGLPPWPPGICRKHSLRFRFPLTGLQGKLNFPTQFFAPARRPRTHRL